MLLRLNVRYGVNNTIEVLLPSSAGSLLQIGEPNGTLLRCEAARGERTRPRAGVRRPRRTPEGGPAANSESSSGFPTQRRSSAWAPKTTRGARVLPIRALRACPQPALRCCHSSPVLDALIFCDAAYRSQAHSKVRHSNTLMRIRLRPRQSPVTPHTLMLTSSHSARGRSFVARIVLALLATLSLGSSVLAEEEPKKPLRAGIIGLDTSHVPAFTKLFNSGKGERNARASGWWPATLGGTDSRPAVIVWRSSPSRSAGWASQSWTRSPKLLEKVDVCCWRASTAGFICGRSESSERRAKPLFIDKPLAGNRPRRDRDLNLARRHGVPYFAVHPRDSGMTCASFAATPGVGEMSPSSRLWGPCSYQSGTPELFFYGIHGIEALFTLMGAGCESVSRTKGNGNDQVTGLWKDGRIGTYRGLLRGKEDFGAVVFGSKSIQQSLKAGSYGRCCRDWPFLPHRKASREPGRNDRDLHIYGSGGRKPARGREVRCAGRDSCQSEGGSGQAGKLRFSS